ncbi:MAG: aminotransferase class I/II-fold pyridoxal phosphate-dependent enzyme [Coriobacteriia bacterium]|nr:aminotransferase class I/II-fold pyridoxal phosphate-dependent enzyme [Coriobacteriia bacterium]
MSWESDFERLSALTCVKWTHHRSSQNHQASKDQGAPLAQGHLGSGDPAGFGGRPIIPAWVADMDLPPVPAVTDAIRALADSGDLGYNFAAAEQLPRAFAERQWHRFGWQLDWQPETGFTAEIRPGGLRLFCDVLQAVELALWAHTSPGDGIVLFTPVYAPFYRAIQSCGCRLVEVPLDPGTWRLDPERLEAAIDPGTRAILTCDPHNPTGRSFSRAELTAIADIAERHDLLVVSDEIWADIVYPDAPPHIPIASISPETERRTVTVAAASKAFNLAGLRCAIAHIGHPGVAERARELPGHLLGTVASTSAAATLAAWTLGDEWLAETLAHLHANRDYLASRLSAELPEVRFSVPEATYLAWLDFSATALCGGAVAGQGDSTAAGQCSDPTDRLLAEAQVALSKGSDFSVRAGSYVRLNFATTRALLEEMIDRIIGAVRGA